MPDSYVFTGRDGIERTFVGERPPSPSEMARLETMEAKPQTDNGALALSGAAKSVPAAARLAEEVATNPGTVAAGRAAGQVTGLVKGAATGNPFTALGAMDVGERAGATAARAAQRVAGPVANALNAAAPYVQTAATLSGAQGALDLAQMAEPNRKDLGFLGIGGGTPDPNHPALLNLLGMKAADGIGWLIKQGLSLGDASRTYWNLKARAK